MKNKRMRKTQKFAQYRNKNPLPEYVDEDTMYAIPTQKYVNSLVSGRKKNPTKTFYGGLTIGILSTLAVLYILFPLADYLNDTLLAYLMK